MKPKSSRAAATKKKPVESSKLAGASTPSDPRFAFSLLARELSAPAKRKRREAVHQLMAIYWKEEQRVNVTEIGHWLEGNQELDRWFFCELIRAAGEEALKRGYSQHKKDIAASKNAAPRAWVLEEWNKRTDRAQKKEPFAREYVHRVKSKFGVVVTTDTITRRWLPKTGGEGAM